MTEVRVPDIGDFTDVPVIEIHVAPGDSVAPEERELAFGVNILVIHAIGDAISPALLGYISGALVRTGFDARAARAVRACERAAILRRGARQTIGRAGRATFERRRPGIAAAAAARATDGARGLRRSTDGGRHADVADAEARAAFVAARACGGGERTWTRVGDGIPRRHVDRPRPAPGRKP